MRTGPKKSGGSASLICWSTLNSLVAARSANAENRTSIQSGKPPQAQYWPFPEILSLARRSVIPFAPEPQKGPPLRSLVGRQDIGRVLTRRNYRHLSERRRRPAHHATRAENFREELRYLSGRKIENTRHRTVVKNTMLKIGPTSANTRCRPPRHHDQAEREFQRAKDLILRRWEDDELARADRRRSA